MGLARPGKAADVAEIKDGQVLPSGSKKFPGCGSAW